MGGEAAGRDFFISYAGDNRVWAEWIAVQLEGAGYTTVYQAADFRPGRDFMHQMQRALSTAGRGIAVLSPAYLASPYCALEWRSVLARDPSGEEGLLVPVRVQPRLHWLWTGLHLTIAVFGAVLALIALIR